MLILHLVHARAAPLLSDRSAKMLHIAKQEHEKKPSSIMTCPCGRTRVFECQLMPSSLHLLQVETLMPHPKNNGAIGNSNAAAASVVAENNGDNSNKSMAPMDWDVIAIYSCPDSCDKSTEEIVIVEGGGNATSTSRK
jgi:hypothetical protein